MGQTGMDWDEEPFNRAGLFLKSPLITARYWGKGVDDTFPKDHEWYIPFTLGHYRSYFINEIKPFYLVYTVKSH